MKKRLIAGMACVAIATAVPVKAADLTPVYKAQPVAPVPAWNWSGIYLGLNGGWGWGTGDQTAGVGDAGFLVPFSTGGGMPGTVAGIDTSGGVVGGHFGFNYQMSNWVLGLEVSAAWADISGTTTMGLTFPGGTTSTATWNTKLKWQATATPRLGYAWQNWLLYAKGGLAAGGADVSVAQVSGTGGAFSATQQRVGWTAGIGAEYALTHNWIVGIEYDYVDLGTESYAGNGTTSTGASRFFSENVKLNYSEVLGRISYKLDWR
jgi:outer membrane immunogenic protein